jgi:tetratricopeptide (TPR) repeat protein
VSVRLAGLHTLHPPPYTLALLLSLLAHPLAAQSLYDLALAARQRGQLDSAYELIQRAAELAPSAAEVQFLLGDIACDRAGRASAFSAFGLARKCKAAFARAVALAPESLTYVASFASYLAQAPGIVGGDKDSAQKLIALVLARDEVRGVMLQAGLWWPGNSAAKERADSAVEAVGARHTDDARAQLRVAGWWEQTRRPERALAVFEAMAARNPNDGVARFFVGRGLVLLKRDPRRAQRHLFFAAAATVPPLGSGAPTFAPGAPWYRLGQTYVQLGMSDSARLCFRRALEINPQLMPARFALDSLTHH